MQLEGFNSNTKKTMYQSKQQSVHQRFKKSTAAGKRR
jgi:hypothetical protein